MARIETLDQFRIETLDQFIALVKHINQKGNHYKSFVYRGQSVADWLLESGAFRRIKSGKEKAQHRDTTVSCKDVKEYLGEKIQEVKKRTPTHEAISELCDLDLLVEMQHFGAATHLIDFTHNSLIALYFAVSDYSSSDGKVYCIDFADNDKVESVLRNRHMDSLDHLFSSQPDKLYAYNPIHNNHRIIKQDSIFLFNHQGVICENLIDNIIIIDGERKAEIMRDLHEVVGLSDEQIYPDFMGYLQANSSRYIYKVKSALDFFNQAMMYEKQKHYGKAIEYYQKSLDRDPDKYKVLMCKSRCHGLLKDYESALKEGLKAKQLDDRPWEVWNDLGLIYTHLDKTILARNHYDEASKRDMTEKQRVILQNNYAWLYIRQGQLPQAEECLLSIQEEHRDFNPCINLGHIWLIRGNKEKAMGYYKACCAFNLSKEQFSEIFRDDYEGAKLEQQNVSKEVYMDEILSELLK